METNRYHHLRIRTLCAAHRDPVRVLRFLDRIMTLAQRRRSVRLESLARELRGAVLGEMSFSLNRAGSRRKAG